MPKQFNESNDKFDTFTKMYRKVLLSNELSFLQKFILSDIISFQLDKKPYMRTSKSLAKMLGDYGKGTISKGFQELARKGIIITRPDTFGDKTDSQYDLRFAEVVNIDQWVRSDEYLESTGFVPEEIIPQSNWIQSKTNTKEAKAKRRTESETIDLMFSAVSDEDESLMIEIEFNTEEVFSKSTLKFVQNQRTIFDEINEREFTESTPLVTPQVQEVLVLEELEEQVSDPIKSDSIETNDDIRTDEDSLKYSNKSITLSNGVSARILDNAVYFFNETARRSDGFVLEGKSKSNQKEFDEYLLGCMNIKF
jgi:hypothetical protein